MDLDRIVGIGFGGFLRLGRREKLSTIAERGGEGGGQRRKLFDGNVGQPMIDSMEGHGHGGHGAEDVLGTRVDDSGRV